MGIAKSLVVIQWASLALLIIGVIGQRTQLLPFKIAFGGFALALLVLSITAVISIIVLGLRYGPLGNIEKTQPILAFALGLFPLIIVMGLVGSGFKVPKIHDISTDLSKPLEFKHAQSLRKLDENSLALPKDHVIQQQREFYTDIKPLVVKIAPKEVYSLSLRIAEKLGWEVTYQNESELHIEAVERTALFGFADDIVIAVSQTSAGESEGASVVNLRSVSRVGVSDLGANAKRIQRFYAALKKETDASI